jgi:hypothetical protein
MVVAPDVVATVAPLTSDVYPAAVSAESIGTGVTLVPFDPVTVAAIRRI